MDPASANSEPALWRQLLVRIDRLFANHLVALRRRGRTGLADAVPGGVVEDDEAARLVESLYQSHRPDAPEIELRDDRPAAAAPAGIARAARVFGLDPFEVDVLLLALVPELDARYARLITFLNDHASRPRPTAGLVLEVLHAGGAWSPGELAAFRSDARLARWGLLELEGDGPLSTRALRVAPSFWPRLLDERAAAPIGRLVTDGPRLADLVLEPRARERACAIAAALTEGRTRTVIVRGPAGSGRDALAQAIAATHGAPILLVTGDALAGDPRGVVREASWYGASLIVSGAAGAPPSDLEQPLICIGETGGFEQLLAARPDAMDVQLERPALVASRRIWERFVPTDRRDASLDLDAVVARFPFSPRRIEVAAARVTARADRAPISTADLLDACRALPDQRFEGLADRLPPTYEWDDLVVPDETRRELELAVAWARGGRIALQEWGVTSRSPTGRGLGCLFHGPPGTGKTMAAQVLASAVGLDVVRIDLSQVVSKYIGETEKNVSRVFDAAREANVILFFDEADALFGKRSEVKDAHDRYANIETGYLLQRIELHDGLTILATNLRGNLDDAFLRRLHVIAEFPLPDSDDRRRIWQRLLPSPAHRDGDIDLELLTIRFKLTGGEIRNAVVTGALLAVSEGRRLAMSHLVRGVSRELRKSGRLVDPDDFGSWRSEAIQSVASSRTRRA